MKPVRELIKGWVLFRREEISLWAWQERANLAQIEGKRDQANFKCFMATCVLAWWIWIPRSKRHKVNQYIYISSFPWCLHPVHDGSISKASSRVGGLKKYLQFAWNFYQVIGSVLTKTGRRALELRESSQNAQSYSWLLGSNHQKVKAGQKN